MYQHQGKPGADTASSGVAVEPAPTPAPDSETVSLHTPVEIQAVDQAHETTLPPAPEVFAEIWKDGMRIGSVYTDGRAVLSTAGGGAAAGMGGNSLPYLRAQEISRMVGGEVHFVDLPALHVAQTRNQLRAVYGA